MRYSDLVTFLTAGLTALGYGTTNPDVGEPLRTMPLINPGPATAAGLQRLSPGTTLFVTLGNGIGLSTEHLFDRPFITVRSIGQQNDFDSAERLAYDVDKVLLSVDRNSQVGSTMALYINRTGGAPALIDFDSASRHHFQATYVTEAQTGY